MTVARGGRLKPELHAAMQRLNESVGVDSELWREDIEGSVAHVRGLEAAGVLQKSEADELVRGLERITKEIESGAFTWDPVREDVHMNIESRLSEIVGPVG